MKLRERVDRGDIVLNYGLQVVYRNQGTRSRTRERARPRAGDRRTGPQPQTPERDRARPTLLRRLIVTPDVWFKLHYKALTIEFEGIGVFGKIEHPGILAVDRTSR